MLDYTGPDGSSIILAEGRLSVLLSGQQGNALTKTPYGLFCQAPQEVTEQSPGLMPAELFHQVPRTFKLNAVRGEKLSIELPMLQAVVNFEWRDTPVAEGSLSIVSSESHRNIAGRHQYYHVSGGIANQFTSYVTFDNKESVLFSNIGNRVVSKGFGWSLTEVMTTNFKFAKIEVRTIGDAAVIEIIERDFNA